MIVNLPLTLIGDQVLHFVLYFFCTFGVILNKKKKKKHRYLQDVYTAQVHKRQRKLNNVNRL